MAIFREIRIATDLPPELTSREALSFDMKARLSPPPNHFEIAKDVATFANATGGVLLIGAVEDKANARLGKYDAMSERDARATRDEIEKAISARCFPKPLVDPVILPRDNGFVVAVNVWPFPSAAVGVKIRCDQADGYNGDAFVFPMRLATRCHYVTPEQLPMLMLPEHRRSIILLDRIHNGDEVLVCGENLDDSKFTMVEVRPMENVLILRWQKGNAVRTTSLPLDAVRSVWQEAPKTWRITLSGWIYSSDTERSFRPVRRQG